MRLEASMTTTDPTAEVRRIFDAQVANRWAIAGSTAAQRIVRLARLRTAMRDRRLELLEAIHADFGKHAVEAEVTELLPVIEELTNAIRQLGRWMKPRRVGTPLTLLGIAQRGSLRGQGRGAGAGAVELPLPPRPLAGGGRACGRQHRDAPPLGEDAAHRPLHP